MRNRLTEPCHLLLSPSKQEGISLPAMYANTIVSSSGLETKTISTTPSVILHKSPHNLIASAMDWPKRTSKMNLKPKAEYIKFLKDNMIINNRHYELYLSNYPY